MRTVARGLAEEFAADAAWIEFPIALVDVETTGRDASVDRVVEIGIAVGRGGQIVARDNWLIQPGVPIPEEARLVHGISDADVEASPRVEAIAHEVAAALSGCVPAAYNAAFDRAFIVGEFARSGVALAASRAPVPVEGAPVVPPGAPPALRKDVEWIDPLVWAREIQREERSKALGEVAARLGVPLEKAHRASDDAEAALKVMLALGRDVRVPRTYAALVQEQRRLAMAQADERRLNKWR